jgi:hypothetical protein
MSSGLDQLTAQRERSTRRSMPPPRNPPRATPVALPAEPDQPAVVPAADRATTTPETDAVQARPLQVDGASVDQAAAAEPTAAPPRRPPGVEAGPRTLPKTPPVKALPPVESSGPEAELAKYSIYFDGTADEFLEATRVAGRRLKPKLSVSRSSVVRLALERLSDSMSPDEVALELSRNAVIARSGTGRPRL